MKKQLDTSKISTWLWKWPARFSLVTALGTIIVTFLINLIYAKFIPSQAYFGWVLAFANLGVIISATRWMFRGLGVGDIDQRSFVALYNAGTILSVFLGTVLAVSAPLIVGPLAQYVMAQANILAICGLLLSMLIYMFTIGMALTEIYLIYRRARNMGVGKWKAILCIPFSVTMLLAPGYLLSDGKSTKKSMISIQSKWYTKLTDWVLKNPFNNLFSLMIIMLITVLIAGSMGTVLMLGQLVLFFVWNRVAGSNNAMRQQVGGTYTMIGVAINVAIIAVFVIATIIAMGVTQAA